MRLGQKIALGFSLILAIAIAIGLLGITKMLAVQGESVILAAEYVPEVEIASRIEREMRLAMYDLRAYGLTFEGKLLESGRQHLDQVDKGIQEADALEQRQTRLVALKGAVIDIRKDLADYRVKVDETSRLVAEHDAIIVKLNAAANVMNAKATGFFSRQLLHAKGEIAGATDADILKERLAKLEGANEILADTASARAMLWRSYGERHFDDIEIAEEPLTETATIFKSLYPITHKAEDIEALKALEAAIASYAQGIKALHLNAGSVQRLAAERGSAANALALSVSTLATKGMDHTVDVARSARDSLGMSSAIMMIGLCVATVTGALLAFLITRGIVKALVRIIDDLGSCSKQTASASEQVASGSQSLADGTTQTAASLEETSASMEEMGSLVSQTTRNTISASDLAVKARETGEQGAAAMIELAKAITEIKANADQTAKIVKTIDEIAFQTNLLALNAAVEAARAGDAGKGFAVVAEEVRNLAQRAGTAARNTSELIEKSVKSAENGVLLSVNVSTAVGDMTGASRKVSELVGEIAASAKEIAQGIDQVSKAVRQMDQVTQSNAAAAEENSAVGEEMSAQAQSLNQLVIGLEGMVRKTTGGAESMVHMQQPHRSTIITAKPIHASGRTAKEPISSLRSVETGIGGRVVMDGNGRHVDPHDAIPCGGTDDAAILGRF